MNTGCCMIPIKCFTCGFPLADLYRTYKRNVLMRKKEMNENVDRIQYLKEDCEKSIEGIIMDEMGIKAMCCRSMILTHRDI
jgi:DNA-directed RNA polymerase subunit N (RpoN/RPB10)